MTGAPAIAVVGAGLIGRRHIERVARLARLAAVIDPDPATRRIADDLGAPWYADLGTALAAGRPDGAIVATPNQLHVAHGLACLGAGIPVLVEKPIAHAAAEAETLVRAAETTGVPLLVGHHRRHNPLIAAARAAIDAGRLGEIVAVDARFWLYKPDDYFAPAWRRQPGAGPVFINLIHDIDLLRHLCGEIDSVQATQSSRIRGFAVEDTAAILLTFACGALGTVTVSDTAVAPWSWEMTAAENPAYPHAQTHCYTIGGTRASLSVPDLQFWTHPGQRSWWQPIAAETLPCTPADPLDLQLEHFCDVIRGAAEPLVGGRDGLATLRVVDAVKTAAETGRAQAP